MGRNSKSKAMKFGKRKRKQLFNGFKNDTLHSTSVGNERGWETDCGSLRVETEENEQQGFKIKGRRVVDIAAFYKAFQDLRHTGNFCCTLQNVNITGEKINGFQSTLFLKCNMCLEKFSVETCQNENSISDVNYGAVLGITSTGGGYSQLEELTGILDIPCMSSKTYNEIRKKVGDHWISIAKANMLAAAEEEKQAAIERGDVDFDGTPLITVVTDGCWSKRSYRNNYSALSGAAGIVGFHTQKIIFLSVKNKFCIICEVAKNRDTTARAHECSANFTGPSTAMEAVSIVEGFKNSENLYGIRYNKLIADGDSSVYKKILDARPYANTHIQKIECRNHLFRNLRTKIRLFSKNTKYSKKIRDLISSREFKIIIGIKKAVAHWKSNTEYGMNKKTVFLAKDIVNTPFRLSYGLCELFLFE